MVLKRVIFSGIFASICTTQLCWCCITQKNINILSPYSSVNEKVGKLSLLPDVHAYKKLIRWWFWNPLFALHINCLPASSISLLKHSWSSEGFFWHAQLQKLKKRSQPVFCIQAKQKNENQRGISQKQNVIIITNSFWFVFPTENKPSFFLQK